jgi:hypothetical protein
MSFNANNYTVSIVLLMALTLFIAGVRMRKPFETNWVLFYWVLITVVSFRYPDDTFDPRIVMVGLAAGLLLRFEFLGRAMARVLMFIEAAVWAFILYTGFVIITTA